MSILNQFKLFAQYNKMLNRRILDSAERLTEEQLVSDRGAFFKSVLGTLNHLLIGDIGWLKRFQTLPAHEKALEYLNGFDKPTSLDAILFDDIESLRKERERLDEVILEWVNGLETSDIEGSLSYTNMAGVPQRKKLEGLIGHLFLHQTHHRGQITTLLSQFDIDPGVTDVLELIDDRSP